MSSETQTAPVSKALYWVGWVISALPILLLLFSAVTKLLKPAFVVESFPKLGWNPDLSVTLGIVELACTVLYIIPSTTILGAILVTGYLGGAVATHVRIDEPFIAPIILGVLVWLGPLLRIPRLRKIIPLTWRS
jgi:DoxX-like family